MTLLFLALTGAAQAATPTLSNSGFEKKTLTGWNVTGTTSTSIVKATNSYGAYTPAYGGYMAWVSAYGCNGNSGLPGTQPETLSQTFSATAGDTLSGRAYFKANDALPRNDSGEVRMVGPDGNATTLLSWDVQSVGTNGGSPWTPWTFTFPTTGTYTLKALSINGVSTSGGSCTNPSVVGLDLPDPLDYLTPVAMLQQQIVVSPPTGVTYGDPSFTILANATSGLPLGYSSSTPLVCSVDPSTGTVSIVGAGGCQITASQAGDSLYLPTSTPINFTIAPAQATIQADNKAKAYDGATYGDPPGPLPASALTYTLSGFKYGDTEAALRQAGKLSGSASCGFVRAAGPAVGTYPQAIGCTQGSLTSPNYSFTPGSAATMIIRKLQSGPVAFAPPPGGSYKYGDGDFCPANATDTGGGPLELPVTCETAPETPACATVDGLIHVVSPGDCTFTATQPDDPNYEPGPPLTDTFTIAKGDQTIDFPTPQKSYGDPDFDPATASSGLAVSYASSTPSVCTIVAGKVHIVAAGDCHITASQPGDDNWNAATPVERTFTIAKHDQTIAFPQPPDKATTDSDFAPGATATSGLAVSYASSTPSVCTIVAGKVHIVSAGTCTVTASQAGNDNYNSAADITRSFAIGKGDQTIDFPKPPDKATGDSDFDPNGTATSGLAVSYASSTPSVCTTVAGKIHIVGAGICTVTASQPGNANWNAATPVTKTFNVVAGSTGGTTNQSQAITFGPLQDRTYDSGNLEFDVSATADSLLPVSFSASGQCTVSGHTVHITGPGSCTITASQEGGTNGQGVTFDAAANVQRTFTIAKRDQTVDFNPASKTYGDQDFNVSATAHDTNQSSVVDPAGPVTFSSTDTDCTVTPSGTVHIVRVGDGNCDIRASAPGNGTYAPSSVSRAVRVNPAPLQINPNSQTKQYGAADPTLTYGLTGFVKGETQNSANVTGSASCSISAPADVGTYSNAITCARGTLSAPNYSFQTGNAALTITKANQAISFPVPQKSYGDPDFDPATASSGLPVSYTSLTTSVCTIVAGKVHIVALGTCKVTASQAGNGNYNPAVSVTQSFTIGKSNQTIDFPQPSAKYVADSDFAPGATATSGLAVTYVSSTTSVCTIVAGKVHIVAAGTCTITASQAGNTNYNAAPSVSRSFTVSAKLCTTNKCESLMINPNPAPGATPATVTAGQTMAIGYTDDSPIGTASIAPTAKLNGVGLPVTVTRTSGQPFNYVTNYKRDLNATNQSLLTFSLPTGLGPGSYSILMSVHDGDGDQDIWSWPITVR